MRLTLSLLGAMICAAVLNAQVNPVPRLPAKPYPPAPRLADGTPNLGPTEPNKGYWHLTQFQDYKQLLLSPKEIPYQPWARQIAMQRRRPTVEVRPAGLLHAAVGTAADDDAVSDGDPPAARSRSAS